jgi:hypothetical protein
MCEINNSNENKGFSHHSIGEMIHQNAARCRVLPASAVVAVLIITMKLMLFVTANMAGDSSDTENTSDETTATQNLIKILYCTS